MIKDVIDILLAPYAVLMIVAIGVGLYALFNMPTNSKGQRR
jgi:hypothetical protein